jgi:lactoylglutathione lyase
MIRVKNIDESLKFYTELLDMNLTQQVALEDADLYYLSDEDGQTQLELTYNREKPVPGCYTHGSGFGHLAFETDSMEKFTEKMNKLGYAYSYEPFYMPEVNMMIAFIKDPDGYEIEVMAKN